MPNKKVKLVIKALLDDVLVSTESQELDGEFLDWKHGREFHMERALSKPLHKTIKNLVEYADDKKVD